MTTEVAAAQLGVLRSEDVRYALGDEFHTARSVEVLVATATGLPFAGVVLLADKPSGRGDHRALRCPACGMPRFRLYARDGRLGCGGCMRVHVRRNIERTCASWSRGGREEDRLLRLVAGRSRPTPAAIDRGLRLAHELVSGDEDRAGAAIQRGEAALTAVEPSP
jgi:hypothetical protein